MPAGTVIKIDIGGFKNPIQVKKEYNVFIVETTGELKEHTVDRSPASVTVNKPAKLVDVSFTVSPIQTTKVGVVQEENTMRLSFSSPVPLNRRCIVSYFFPKAFYDAR